MGDRERREEGWEEKGEGERKVVREEGREGGTGKCIYLCV